MSDNQCEQWQSVIPGAQFLTVKQGAELLNIPYWKFVRFLKANPIKHYCLYNKRKLFRLSDVLAAVEASCANGGSHD